MGRKDTRSGVGLGASSGSLVVFVLLASSSASAGNGVRPRTPVVWADVPCMTLHDRSQSATFHLPYAIPFEDTDVTVDEVPDSRTHQFFGFCRSRAPQDFLPTWVTQADVDESIAAGLFDAGAVETDEILELVSAWDGCWYRINADDARLPITQANADAGVEWDTTDLPAGGYTLYGYTHEPVFNAWWQRPGVLKLHDGDPDAAGPVGAFITGEVTPYRDETVTLEGCVDAPPDTTFSVSYATVSAPTEWTEYESGLSIDGDRFTFDITPPAPLHGESGMLRVDFTDPTGRTYTTFQFENILVIDADKPVDCGDGGGFIATPCEETDGSDGTSSGLATTSETLTDDGTASTGVSQTAGAEPESTGCGCNGASPGARLGWAALPLLALRRRRARIG